MQDHIQVSDNVVDLTSNLSDNPDECNNYTISGSSFFTASPTPSRSSTPNFISSLGEEFEAIYVATERAEFSSDDEVATSASHNHSNSITVSNTRGTLSTLTAATHSSSTGGVGSILPVVSTTHTTAVSSTLSESQANSSPTDIAQTPAFSPARPKKVRLPHSKFGSKSRCFNPAWYNKHDWLEYSVEEDACFF